jgi:hypothetical protein
VVELLLDLAAREVDGGTTRHQTLAVGCTPADLERMLEDASDNVRVSFDAEALARAIDPDIDAHGLREKMTLLAVVVATTGAAAGTAQAMPVQGPGGGGTGTAVTDVRDMPADSISASAASTEGAAATRANPSEAAAAAVSDAPSGQVGPYSGGAPFQGSQATTQPGLDPDNRVLPSGHHMAPTVKTDAARDLPSDSVRASQPSPVGRIAAGREAGSIDSTTFVVVGGIALALLGAAFGATAANRNTPKPT